MTLSSSESVSTQASLAIARGSKSFALASLLFDADRRREAHALYAWCRAADDAVDALPSGASREERLAAVERLRQLTDRAWNGEEDGLPPAFRSLAWLRSDRQVPREYIDELLNGFVMDAEGERYETLAKVELYSYRVAGVVGLLMAHVMGVSDARALRAAAELGIAMQLTNIARDVVDDARLGRVYLPADWLAEEGVDADPASVLDPAHRARVHRVVLRLLDEADRRYEIGLAGVPALSPRCAIAVGAAARIYRAIGALVRSRGERAWDRRAVVPSWRKWLSVVAASGAELLRAPRRWYEPWKQIPITGIWRLPE